MTKLLIGGCSFTQSVKISADKIEVTEGNSYAYKAAMGLGIDTVIDVSMSGKGNERIWRKMTKVIESGEVGKGDYIIVQYTDTERQEFWVPEHKGEEGSVFTEEADGVSGYVHHYHPWPYTDEQVSKFNMNISREKSVDTYDFLREYTRKHYSPDWTLAQWKLRNMWFQWYLYGKGFRKVYFIRNVYNHRFLETIEPFKNNVIDVEGLSWQDGNWVDCPGCHLSVQGHVQVGSTVTEFIKKAENI